MTPEQSICIYHNGNSRILQHYRSKFSHLKFSGNWAESVERPSHGHLWEICFADATRENLSAALSAGIFILRHISTYQDDQENLLPECQQFNYDEWQNNVVASNICFANQVVSDVTLENPVSDSIAMITTGRTANIHLELVLERHGRRAFEYSKQLDQAMIQSASAILLWRKNHWDCLTSTWIAIQTEYKKAHQVANTPIVEFDNKVDPIDLGWINTTWINLCQLVLDHAMFYQYVCQRPITHTTTEYIVEQFQSKQQKLSYNKEQLISNYQEIKQQYEHSDVAKLLDLLYTNVTHHINAWNLEES